MKNLWYYEYPVGKIGVEETDGSITRVFFAGEEIREDRKRASSGFELNESALIIKAAKQLDEYFKGARRRFELPLRPLGTVFQQSVWNALQAIPYGETKSYIQIAQTIGNPLASRAVGLANNKNPIMIIIPCHRVIGSSGSLVGYAGGLEMKRKLLEIEKE